VKILEGTREGRFTVTNKLIRHVVTQEANELQKHHLAFQGVLREAIAPETVPEGTVLAFEVTEDALVIYEKGVTLDGGDS